MHTDPTARNTHHSQSNPSTRTQSHLFLVPPAQQTAKHSLLALWHLLSLDAPTVAVVWTYFVASCCHVSLPWTSPVAMFLAVWMLYAADRLLDARTAKTGSHEDALEERHRFHQTHRRWFVSGIACCAVLLAAILIHDSWKEMQLYAALGSLLFAYFFLIHLWPFPTTSNSFVNVSRLPKEFAVGIFFSAAIFIPTVTRNPNLRITMLPSAILFAAVCTLNCLYIYTWEHPDTRSAHGTTQFAVRRLSIITCTVAAIALCAVVLTWPLHRTAPVSSALVPLACCLSSVCFLALQRFRFSSNRTTLRATVDLVLLTPVLVAPFLHLLK